MKDEFFALTLTGVGALFGTGFITAGAFGSALKAEWPTVAILLILAALFLSVARSDARTEIKSGIYRGRLFHRRDGGDAFKYGSPSRQEQSESSGATLQ